MTKGAKRRVQKSSGTGSKKRRARSRARSPSASRSPSPASSRSKKSGGKKKLHARVGGSGSSRKERERERGHSSEDEDDETETEEKQVSARDEVTEADVRCRTNFAMSKLPFQRFFREVVSSKIPNARISKPVHLAAQSLIEEQSECNLQGALVAANHAGRITISSKDFELPRQMKNRMSPAILIKAKRKKPSKCIKPAPESDKPADAAGASATDAEVAPRSNGSHSPPAVAAEPSSNSSV